MVSRRRHHRRRLHLQHQRRTASAIRSSQLLLAADALTMSGLQALFPGRRDGDALAASLY